MKIICARLTTGEELIAKVVNQPLNSNQAFEGSVWESPHGDVVLEDARIVTLQSVPGRGVGISFIPFTMANPEGLIKIDLEKHAMAVYPPQADLERAYIGENSSIALATPETARSQGINLS